jgi:hypothetical protein
MFKPVKVPSVGAKEFPFYSSQFAGHIVVLWFLGHWFCLLILLKTAPASSLKFHCFRLICDNNIPQPVLCSPSVLQEVLADAFLSGVLCAVLPLCVEWWSRIVDK